VSLLVNAEIASCSKSYWAVLALERLLLSVSSHMNSEVAFFSKLFVATRHEALVEPFSLMLFEVTSQLYALAELLITAIIFTFENLGWLVKKLVLVSLLLVLKFK
jgi:hypothetical protein